MYKVLFISSWKSAGALATPKGMTFHFNTRPLGVTRASSSWAVAVRSTCQKPLRLSILVLYLHWAIRSRVLSMLRILPEWFWVFLLTSPQSTTSRRAVDPGFATRKQGLQ